MVNVKELFAERYPSFTEKHKVLSWFLVQFARRLWKENVLQEFAKENSHYHGADFVKKGFEFINFSIEVDDLDLKKIQTSGPLIVVANHPIGSLDGVGLFGLIASVREDTKVIANSLLYSVDQMKGVIIPTDNLGKGANRKSIQAINNHLRSGGALVIFPAGSVSRIYDGIIQDAPWNSAFIKLALKNQCSILPVYFDAKNSKLFYILSRLCFPLSTIWLIRELYYYKNKKIRAYVGDKFAYSDLSHSDKSASGLSDEIRNAVYNLK